MTATTLSPVEYVRSLSLADKEAVLRDLIREAVPALLREHGGGVEIPLQTTDGEPFGVYTPQAATTPDRRTPVPTLTDAQREATRQALATLDDTFDVREHFDELNRAAANRTPG
jgi:hypothetical protein